MKKQISIFAVASLFLLSGCEDNLVMETEQMTTRSATTSYKGFSNIQYGDSRISGTIVCSEKTEYTLRLKVTGDKRGTYSFSFGGSLYRGTGPTEQTYTKVLSAGENHVDLAVVANGGVIRAKVDIIAINGDSNARYSGYGDLSI